MKKTINESLFWSHLALIALVLASPLFLSFLWVLAIVALHRIHVWLFHGCLLSRLQHNMGCFSKRIDFLQFASRKLFGKQITAFQSRMLDYSISVFAVILAFFNLFFI